MSILIIAGMFGPQEIILILVIVLLLFGGRKIPELMKGLGRGMKEFKKASNDDEEEEIEDKSKKKDPDKISDK